MRQTLLDWDFDDTTRWLSPVDLFLAERILALSMEDQGARAIVEVGVWRGAWLLQLLAARPDVTGVGVDPYPGAPGLREELLARASSKGVAERLVLVSDLQGVCSTVCSGNEHKVFDIAHIDGLHVEHQVRADLEFAVRHCAETGVIIVDDYLHPSYPGIASAMYSLLADRQFAMFLVTCNKAYLCRAETHESRLVATRRMLEESGLVWMRYGGEHSSVPYVQPPDVQGFQVLLCVDPANSHRVLRGLHPPVRHALRWFTSNWIPIPLQDSVRSAKRAAGRMRPSHLARTD